MVFDGGTVAASALVGRYLIINGTTTKVTANTASSGTATVVYRMTKLHKAAFCISALTLAGLLAFQLIGKRKKAPVLSESPQ